MNHNLIVEMLLSEERENISLAVGILSCASEEDRFETKKLFDTKLITSMGTSIGKWIYNGDENGRYYISTNYNQYYKKYGLDLYLSLSLTKLCTSDDIISSTKSRQILR